MGVGVDVRRCAALKVCPRDPVIAAVTRFERISEALAVPLDRVGQQIADCHGRAPMGEEHEVARQLVAQHGVQHDATSLLRIDAAGRGERRSTFVQERVARRGARSCLACACLGLSRLRGCLDIRIYKEFAQIESR